MSLLSKHLRSWWYWIVLFFRDLFMRNLCLGRMACVLDKVWFVTRDICGTESRHWRTANKNHKLYYRTFHGKMNLLNSVYIHDYTYRDFQIKSFPFCFRLSFHVLKAYSEEITNFSIKLEIQSQNQNREEKLWPLIYIINNRYL